MEMRKLNKDELDWAVLPCVYPDWRDKMREGMDARRKWLEEMMDKGLNILVALETVSSSTIAVALVEYLPIELAPEPVAGRDLLFINCIWVIEPFWRKGVAKQLMEALFEDVKDSKGIAVLAYEGDQWFGYFDYMPVWFFEKFGFKEADRDSSRVLLWREFKRADPPSLLIPKPEPKDEHEKITVDILWDSQCPWSVWMRDIILLKARKIPKVKVRAINTDDRHFIERYGVSRGVFIDGEPALKRMANWEEVDKLLKKKLKQME
jgi:GNAT superfamily N-acetyltransferase